MGDYQPLRDIKQIIENLFPVYWEKIFRHVSVQEIVSENGIRVITTVNQEDVKKLKSTITKWEKGIIKYQNEMKEILDLDLFDKSNPEAYSPQEFKDDLLANELWTVRSALRSADPDLKLYKSNFYATTPMDIFITVTNILNGAKYYIENLAFGIDLKQVYQIEQLKLDFLEEEGMWLPKVIGLGIRSEMLHRLYPSNFALMTRRSLWGMFYLSDSSDEFVIDEVSRETGKQRTSSNWEYDYQRFCFLNNFIANLVENALFKNDITMQPNLRFGYVNEFLNEIFYQHRKEIGVLTRWR